MYLATGPYGKIIPMAPVSLIVVGAGQRGTGYARWARRHPERDTVVAVAEPTPARRRGPRPRPAPPLPCRLRALHNTSERGPRLDRASRPRQAGRRGPDLH